jgi:hypothetical protein
VLNLSKGPLPGAVVATWMRLIGLEPLTSEHLVHANPVGLGKLGAGSRSAVFSRNWR